MQRFERQFVTSDCPMLRLTTLLLFIGVASAQRASAQAHYKVTISSAPDSTAAREMRLVAIGWWIIGKRGEPTQVEDDTIRVTLPFVLEAGLKDALPVDFISGGTADPIRVRVVGTDLTRVCDESRPRTANKCPRRSVTGEAVGTWITLDIVDERPRLTVRDHLPLHRQRLERPSYTKKLQVARRAI
jgi:hypothetical protein